MSTSLQDYLELLNAEQFVQVNKLKEYARHGIIPRVRGEVWLYLLDALSPIKTDEITSIMAITSQYQLLSSSLPNQLSALVLKTALEHHTHRFFNPTYAGLISSITSEQKQSTDHSRQASSKGSSPYIPSGNRDNNVNSDSGAQAQEGLTLRSQVSRFLPAPPSAPPSRQAFLSMVEEVLGKFYHAERDAGRDSEFRRQIAGIEGSEKDWVWLVTPFMCVLTRPNAVFLGFQKMMIRMREFPPLSSRLASFLTLFRLALPELFSYFEDEQVKYVDVAISWVTTLFSKEMWLGNVLRLWDAYFAAEDMFELHCYVCVAVLATCKETLEELDGSEARLMLLDLPPFDIDRLLQDAANLRISYSLPRPADD